MTETLNEESLDKQVLGKVTDLRQSRGLIKTEKGFNKKIRANLTKILSFYDDKLTNLFRYNENTHEIEILRDQKLHGGNTIQKGRLEDPSVNAVASYISSEYLIDFTNSEVANEIEVIAMQKKYNPIMDFLNKARMNARSVDPFLIIQKYLNIEDTSYNRLALDLVFRGAIARVDKPGIRFDYCLDLLGKQGSGKTNFLRQIFKGFYTEIDTFTEKDDLSKMISVWVVNDDELVATGRSNFEKVKRAITTTELNYRPPYGRSMRRAKVDFIFTRTTNLKHHLKDATGDRRFLPVEVFPMRTDQERIVSDNDLEAIWGAYYLSYIENPKLYYDTFEEEGKLIAEEREKYRHIDEIIERLMWYLDTPIPSDFYAGHIKDYQRENFYHDIEALGVAYKDRDNTLEWIADKDRDRLNVGMAMKEVFNNVKNEDKVRTKIKLYMDNLDGWEYRKSVKFDKRVSSGYVVGGK